jgi:hypothetical protein
MAGSRQRVDPPSWSPRSGRPRVLVEAGDETWRRSTADDLEGCGYEVIGCAGPEPDHRELCPAVDGGRCPGAAHADVVICRFDSSDEHTRGLPAAVAHELRDGASVLLLVDPTDTDRHKGALEGCRVLHRPVAREVLLAEVATAVDDLAHTPVPRTGGARPAGRAKP